MSEMTNPVVWLLNKLNGWKSILGWLIMQSGDFIATHYETFPVASYAELMNWIGMTLLGLGLIHKADKATK